jgi:hypothetical protein
MGAGAPRDVGRVRPLMAPRRIVLFSPFSPDLGGGGTNLRTLVPELQKTMDIRWLYTAAREASYAGTVRVGGPLAGGAAWHDLSRTVALWAGLPSRSLRHVVSELAAQESSRYWIVGHNEGIVVAGALARAGARVHLTIQDDVPDGMLARSRRYRALAPFVRPRYEGVLRTVASIDVTSDGMQSYYRDRLGLSSVVVHPYVSQLPPENKRPTSAPEIRIGHIGSLYAAESWRALLEALRMVAKERGVPAKMTMIGLAGKFRSAAAGFEDLVEFVDDLPEAAAVERLRSAQVLYAMYPFDDRSDVFRRTSLPTKITTYLRSGRPILAHSPPHSTLVDIVERYGLGLTCSSTVPSAIASVLGRVLDLSPDSGCYERARDQVYGVGNVERLRTCLESL